MKEPKFTKGEWIIDYGNTLGHVKAVGDSCDKTPTVARYNMRSKLRGLDPTEEEIANAKLIAAAPDLLRSLTFLLERYESIALSGDAGWWNPDDEEVVISAKSAIKKATS